MLNADGGANSAVVLRVRFAILHGRSSELLFILMSIKLKVKSKEATVCLKLHNVWKLDMANEENA